MNARSLAGLVCRNLVLAILALAAPFSSLALEPAPFLRVQVYPDHYSLAGQTYADLAALAARVEPLGANALQIDGCGAASGKRLVAAVERFHGAYVQGIQIRQLDPREPGCSLQALADTDYYATDERGWSMLP
jgi:hypothetical protein